MNEPDNKEGINIADDETGVCSVQKCQQAYPVSDNTIFQSGINKMEDGTVTIHCKEEIIQEDEVKEEIAVDSGYMDTIHFQSTPGSSNFSVRKNETMNSEENSGVATHSVARSQESCPASEVFTSHGVHDDLVKHQQVMNIQVNDEIIQINMIKEERDDDDDKPPLPVQVCNYTYEKASNPESQSVCSFPVTGSPVTKKEDLPSSPEDVGQTGRQMEADNISNTEQREDQWQTEEDAGDMSDCTVIDEEEEPYCACGQPNSNKMIECCRPKCKYPWWHYKCAGLEKTRDIPTDEWVCSRCNKDQKKGKTKVEKKVNGSTTNEAHPAETGRLTCNTCGRIFIRHHFLIKHEARHKENTCSVCNKVLSGPIALEAHMCTHSGEKPYSCNNCGKSFTTTSSLRRHEMLHTAERIYSCGDCSRDFTTQYALDKHKQVHSGKKSYKCGTCGKCYRWPNNLKDHEVIHTRNFACSKCEKAFCTAVALKSHQFCHVEEKSHVCSTCGKSFSRPATLRSHKLTHDKERPYLCNICGKGFSRKQHVKRHQLSHTQEKSYKCETCKKPFMHLSHLKRHRLIHLGIKQRFVCHECRREFTTQELLKEHQLSHIQGPVTSKICNVCGKGFSSPSKLKRHQIVHNTQDKYKYECQICGRSFSQPAHVRRHQVTHSGEKPYTCNLCGKRFTRKSHLRGHIMLHTGEKPFLCKQCGQGFTRQDALRKHESTHSGAEQQE